MTTISAINGGLSNSTTEASGKSDMVGQDTFLRLLTTQMQNQDPLNPTSNEEFLAQLAQFSSLQELIEMKGSLDNIYMGIASVNNATMSNLLGNEVVALTDKIALPEAGGTEIHWHSEGGAEKTKVNVYDESGSLVWSADVGPTSAGDNQLMWDGQTASGGAAAPGQYRVEIVSTAPDGSTVTTEPRLVGTIDEMAFDSGTPQPSVGGVEFAISDILRVTTATPQP